MIKLLVMDVDGTLTDGKIYMGNSGELFKTFDVKDGCGIKDILPTHGIIPVVITARQSAMLKKRCEELLITEIHQGIRNKLDRLDDILQKISQRDRCLYSYENVAYIGDDILDLQCMKPIHRAGGVIGCPCDAVNEVIQIADFTSSKKAGSGAVREFIEYLIKENKKQERPAESSEVLIENRINEAIEHLQNLNIFSIKIGTYQVNDNFYYMVQEYNTKSHKECRLESHRRYVDIQWIIHGEERIEVANISGLQIQEKYDHETDVAFWKIPSRRQQIVLRNGSYVVLYPENAHRPSMTVREQCTVKKIVGKVKVI